MRLTQITSFCIFLLNFLADGFFFYLLLYVTDLSFLNPFTHLVRLLQLVLGKGFLGITVLCPWLW